MSRDGRCEKQGGRGLRGSLYSLPFQGMETDNESPFREFDRKMIGGNNNNNKKKISRNALVQGSDIHNAVELLTQRNNSK